MTVQGKKNLWAALAIGSFLMFSLCFFAGFLDTQNVVDPKTENKIVFKKGDKTKTVLVDQKIVYKQRENGSIVIENAAADFPGEKRFQIKSGFVIHAEWRTKDGKKIRSWHTSEQVDEVEGDMLTEFRVEVEEVLILTPEDWYEKKKD